MEKELFDLLYSANMKLAEIVMNAEKLKVPEDMLGKLKAMREELKAMTTIAD